MRVRVAGQWLDGYAPTQIEELTTTRNGPENLTFSTTPVPILRGRQRVEVYDFGVPIWSGILTEPEQTEVGTYHATGLYAEASRYPARDGSDNPSMVPNTAIDAAITKGLPWSRYQSFSASSLTSSQMGEFPKVDALLDGWSSKQDEEWRVTPAGEVEHYSRPTDPTWLLVPGFALGSADDDYVSHLSGIRMTAQAIDTPSGTSAAPLPVAVPEVGSAPAAAKWGYRSDVVDLTDLGVLSRSDAQSILDGLRRKGRHRLGVTGSLVVTSGQILTLGGGVPSLTLPKGGDVVRVPGWDTTQDYDDHYYADYWIDRTVLRPKDGTLELVPVGLAERTLLDLAGTTLGARYHAPRKHDRRRRRRHH